MNIFVLLLLLATIISPTTGAVLEGSNTPQVERLSLIALAYIACPVTPGNSGIAFLAT